MFILITVDLTSHDDTVKIIQQFTELKSLQKSDPSYLSLCLFSWAIGSVHQLKHFLMLESDSLRNQVLGGGMFVFIEGKAW